jgi:hypothetical protein
MYWPGSMRNLVYGAAAMWHLNGGEWRQQHLYGSSRRKDLFNYVWRQQTATFIICNVGFVSWQINGNDYDAMAVDLEELWRIILYVAWRWWKRRNAMALTPEPSQPMAA